MNLSRSFIRPSILASLCLLALPTAAPAQAPGENKASPAAEVPSSADAASLQKKANEVQARIRGNEGDRDQLKKAVKINEVALAKEILLRNGFTAKDLENAKISLRTGGGKGGGDTIEISVTCCDPKEITIRRTLENFTKTNQ
jgi:hypothetical protein